MFALSRVPGVPRAPHTHTDTRLEPCLSLPHSSFQDRVLEVLMNSLLIPLSGESNCGGRAGGGLLLLRPSCCHLINSRSSLVPGRSSPNLFLCGLWPSPPASSSQSHALLPPELTYIHFNGCDWNHVFLVLASICLSLHLVSAGASASLSHGWGVGSSACALDGRAVCFSSWHPYPQLGPAHPSSFPSFPLPLATWGFLRDSLFLFLP